MTLPRVVVQQTSHQTVKKLESWDSPSVLPWRCNLTALSQYRNFYFAAYVDCIHVFEPLYPDQIIRKRPTATISLPPPLTSRYGFISASRPQGINHLITRDLGDEEILLVSCDAGDVIAFSVRSIEKEFLRAREQSVQSPNLCLPPLFHENVGASAWGMDVHKAARLIAVSSNTHDIIIFAFALLSEESDTRLDDESASANKELHDRSAFDENPDCPPGALISSRWKSLEDASDSRRRDRHNYAWRLHGHETNIPTVAFCNKESSGGGKIYLLSADIDGQAKVWEVWTRGHGQIPIPQCRGWSVMCLDPAKAQIVSSDEDAYGCIPRIHSRYSRHTNLNNSDRIHHIQDNSQWHPTYVGSLDAPFAQPPSYDTDSSADETIEYLADSGESASLIEEPDIEVDQSDIEVDADMPPDFLANTAKPESGPSVHEDHQAQTMFCNFLVASETFIALSGRQPRNTTYQLVCENAIRQKIPLHLTTLRHMERLNMTQDIPDLGLIIVASQAGRAGVISMTYRPSTGAHGFKVEAIVPFKSEEKQGLRPEQPLLGIAVSPVQGWRQQPSSASHGWEGWQRRQTPSAKPRYRLLLMYYDHTIMSYELSRPQENDHLVIV